MWDVNRLRVVRLRISGESSSCDPSSRVRDEEESNISPPHPSKDRGQRTAGTSEPFKKTVKKKNEKDEN